MIPPLGMVIVSIPGGGMLTRLTENKRGNAMTENMKTVVLTVPDISCDHCVATINRTIGALEGVSTVDASSEAKIVTITFDPDDTSEAHIHEVLEEEGYPVSS
jgi:copper chaperone